MCGFAGLLSASTRSVEQLTAAVERMSATIEHRGPDDSGVWTEPEAGVALAFRRLAIVDLSAHGHQPMQSPSRRFTIAFNGEVYNHDELRRELRALGFTFRGHSDTEVLLAAFEAWGIPAALERFLGMFAMAVWDARTRTVTLARDRMGKKPLFVYADGGGLVTFASELKALRAAPAFDAAIDRDALASYLRYLYVPGPQSIYARVRKLEPGHYLEIRDARAALPESRPFWSLHDVVSRAEADPFTGSDEDAVDELERLLTRAVGDRMFADVPLGAFLSGGIDSSAVVALMVAAKSGPVRTFSIGFSDLGFDESQHARAVAEHLKTDHRDMMVTGADALNVVPQLAEMYDEPFADSSQIPTHLISKLTREHVTVALTGDGGDELFAGYNRYNLGQGVAGRLSRSPRALRQAAGALLEAMPGALVEAGVALLPARVRPPQPVDKLKKFAAVLPLDAEEAYRVLVSQNRDPASLMFGKGEHDVPMPVLPASADERSVEQMQLCDQSTFLADDILQKVDRASMAVSLEVRPPLLDHRVVSFAWRLPRAMRIRDGETKWLLRRVLDRYVPRELVSRPKMGFAIPLAAWLRGPLRPWAEDLLDPSRLGGGLLDPAPVRRLWDEHLSGRHNRAYALWTILMYEAWRRRWGAA